MQGQRTVGQYRAIDLFLFAVMLVFFESLITTASLKWFPNEAYTVSAVAAVTAVVMMRWGPWAAIHAVLGGAVHCYWTLRWMPEAAGQDYVIFCLGNLLCLAALGLIKVLGAEEIRKNVWKSLVFGGTVLLLMQLGRAAVALTRGIAPADAALYVTLDVISMLFTLLLVWIVRRLDGVFENQRHYLERVHRELQKEEGGSL